MIHSQPYTIISNTELPCVIIDKSYKDEKVPPACGGLGGKIITSNLIRQLQPGDFVLDLEKQYVMVRQVKNENYHGSIIEIRTEMPLHTLYVLPENLILCKRKVTKICEKGRWDEIPRWHFQRARQLRKLSTPPEKKLWQYIRDEQLGVKFRSQHPINRYIVDFYARKAGLIVEVDGEVAHTFPDQISYDRERDGFLEGRGLKVLRFSARDVLSNIEGVISEIAYHLKEAVPDNITCGQWRYGKNVIVGDEIFLGCDLVLSKVVNIREIVMDCDVVAFNLEESDNFISNGFIFHICPP